MVSQHSRAILILTNHACKNSTNGVSNDEQVCDRGRVQESVWYLVLSDDHSRVFAPHTQRGRHALVDGLEGIL